MMTRDLHQAARLEAVRTLEGVMSTLSLPQAAPTSTSVGPALDWALEQLAINRPDDPVQALATYLRKYDVERRKAGMGVARPEHRGYK
jgi:hypothetical protein